MNNREKLTEPGFVWIPVDGMKDGLVGYWDGETTGTDQSPVVEFLMDEGFTRTYFPTNLERQATDEEIQRELADPRAKKWRAIYEEHSNAIM